MLCFKKNFLITLSNGAMDYAGELCNVYTTFSSHGPIRLKTDGLAPRHPWDKANFSVVFSSALIFANVYANHYAPRPNTNIFIWVYFLIISTPFIGSYWLCTLRKSKFPCPWSSSTILNSYNSYQQENFNKKKIIKSLSSGFHILKITH